MPGMSRVGHLTQMKGLEVGSHEKCGMMPAGKGEQGRSMTCGRGKGNDSNKMTSGYTRIIP